MKTITVFILLIVAALAQTPVYIVPAPTVNEINAHNAARLAQARKENAKLDKQIAETKAESQRLQDTSTAPKVKGGSLKETTQRMCDDAVQHNRPLPGYCEVK